MNYTKISPLGKREGVGTFDCIYNNQKYKSMEEAANANDFCKIDFVQDEAGIIYFEFSYSKKPNELSHKRLEIQHFPFGIDIMDDNTAVKTAMKILESYDTQRTNTENTI